jgi:thiopeptide-type bacteriocin biosynthesis protein
MYDANDSKSWISAYIYFDGNIYGDECDFVITSLFLPFIKKYQHFYFDSYFFIRYSDTGSHVRIRFSGNKELLEKELKPVFEKYIIESFPVLIIGIGRIKGTPVDASKFFIKWAEYEPETDRYGGKFAIKVAEEFFFCSSDTAIDMLKPLGVNNYPSRLGKGLALMLILLHQMFGEKEKALRLVNMYSDGYLRNIAVNEDIKNFWIETFNDGFKKQASNLTNIVNILWEGMENEEELPEELSRYYNALALLRIKLFNLFNEGKITLHNQAELSWDNSLFRIIPSYIHMMNNRLGISIQDESYLAHIIALGLQGLIDNPPKEGEQSEPESNIS